MSKKVERTALSKSIVIATFIAPLYLGFIKGKTRTRTNEKRDLSIVFGKLMIVICAFSGTYMFTKTFAYKDIVDITRNILFAMYIGGIILGLIYWLSLLISIDKSKAKKQKNRRDDMGTFNAKTKDELVGNIKYIIKEEIEKVELIKNESYQERFRKYLDNFLKAVENCIFPEPLTEEWSYYVNCGQYGAFVLLQRTGYEMYEGHRRKVFNPIFSLINIRNNYISIEEFAALHNTNDSEVKKWIDNGNLMKIRLESGDIYIHEFDRPVFGPENIDYNWKDFHYNNGKFPFLNEYDQLSIRQDKDMYIARFVDNYFTGNEKVMRLSKEEKNELKETLICNQSLIINREWR